MLTVVATGATEHVVSRPVRCTDCGCGYSFLRIVNAEPVPVVPCLTIGSWLPLCAAPSLHGYHLLIFFVLFCFVIYFFLLIYFLYICPYLLYTLVCAIPSYFPILFWSWTYVGFSCSTLYRASWFALHLTLLLMIFNTKYSLVSQSMNRFEMGVL